MLKVLLLFIIATCITVFSLFVLHIFNPVGLVMIYFGTLITISFVYGWRKKGSLIEWLKEFA